MDDEATSYDGRLKEQLQRLITAIEATGRAVLPGSNRELLRSIVEAAAKIFGAAGASIALIDEQTRELEFMVAYNPYNPEDQKIVGMRIPVNKGIAGYVAMTGQPIAISNVQDDARFNRDFAAQTGYIPNSILAMPLVSHDTVIGVMEVLDKMGAASFDLQDMELLSIFAGQAAIAIHQSRYIDHLQEALVEGLKGLVTAEISQPSDELVDALDSQPSADEDLLLLATLINDISAMGETERDTCLKILHVFREYSQTRSSSFYKLPSYYDE